MRSIVKSFIQWASSLALFLAITAVNAQTIHVSHCMAGCPESNSSSGASGNEIVVRHLFAASINGENGLADWVAYRVLADTVGVASLLPRFWYEDNLLTSLANVDQIIDGASQIFQPDLTGRADRSYRINEIIISTEDQGRLAPMSSFAGTPYWSELNYISNLAALPNDLRVGSWARLDQAVNELAAREGEIFVVSGPLYRIQNVLNTRPDNMTDKPSAFFKVIATESNLAAFIFPYGIAQHANYCDQLNSLESIEQESGLTVFPEKQAVGDASLQASLGCKN
ncbi:MAG: hypothetical protein COA96_01900 [SAR86 cluster bacterium]|uniref:Endonuclease n=1 Tax=SAR86 cluster bacterium TaxID=2030880 RepID=A0A2A5B995_9GAMM|nr:MAG: hypothetical protein COA96_01900 [SAR86 cluster bacterium]